MAEKSPLRRSTVVLLAAPILMAIQGAVIACYVTAPFSRSRWVAWFAITSMFLVWIVQWTYWRISVANLRLMPLFGQGKIARDDTVPRPRATVIVAARHEEAAIASAVRSMAGMEYPGLELVVVDDHSTDATPRILDDLARTLSSLRVIHDPPPQPGWMGKQNALWHAVQQADPECAWLLFTDADIVFGPTVLKDAIAFCEERALDFMTCIPYLEMDSLPEELVLITGWLRHLSWCQYSKLNDPKGNSIGIGAFLLVRRSAYLAAGGHAAIAQDPCDDVALAALLKKHGARMGFGWAGDQLRCRQYPNYADMMRNLVRKHRVALRDQYSSYICAAAYQFIHAVLPFPMAIAGAAAQVLRGEFSVTLTVYSLMAAVAYTQGAWSYSVGRSICRMRRIAPFLYPVAGLLRMWIGIRGLGQRLMRRPLDWRGRILAATPGLQGRDGT